MLVLLSFALVLVATVLLVLGLLNDDGLTLIYVSIASSVAAAVVLLAALRLNKPRLAEQRASGPAPLPEPVRPSRAAALPTPAVTPVASEAQPAVPPPGTASEEPALEPAAPAAASPTPGDEWLATDQDAWPADDAWEEADEVEFPIADYDSLTVGQILPLLPQLYADEYDVVEEREHAGQARPQVLAKLAELREGASTTASEDGPSSDAAIGTDSVALDPLASYTEAATAGWEDDDWFPIEDYESLSAAQIRPLLPELDDEELSLVRAREMSLGRRRSLLDEIDRQLAAASPTAPPAPAVTATKATKAVKTTKGTAKRPAARKAPAGKTPAKTAAAAKKNGVAKPASPASKATPAKKAPTKRAIATKAAATKNGSGRQTGVAKRVSPASKVTSANKPAAAKKTAPTRVAPVQKSAPAKKAGAAGKAAAKKAAPAKKAPPAKKAAATKRAPRA